MTATASVEEVADAVAHLSLADLDRLSTAVLERMPNRGKAGLHFQESLLLQAINETLTYAQQERYALLIARRRAESLTETEHAELLELTTVAESLDARRLELMARLAALRQVPLTRLIADLNLPQQTV